jgi:hypothetical protein
MFVRYYLELPVPAGAVEEVLAHDPAAWVPGVAEDARRRCEELLAEVGSREQEARSGFGTDPPVVGAGA